MPIYDVIEYSNHALYRMRRRRISMEDVELALRIGDCSEGEDNTLEYTLGPIRVVIAEYKNEARVVTVIRLKGAR